MRLPSPARLKPPWAAMLLGIGTTVLLASARFTHWTVALLVGSTAWLAWSVCSRRLGRWWLPILFAPAVVAAYTWSLDERMHVRIEVSPHGAVANVEGNVAVLHHSPKGTAIGLYAAGGAPLPVGSPESPRPPLIWQPVAFLGSVLGVDPGPGWDGLRVVEGRAVQNCTGALRRIKHNARGEVSFPPGAAVTLGNVSASTYSIDLDVLRAEGVRGVLINLNQRGHGVMLEVRGDARETEWVRWTGSPGGIVPGGRAAAFDLSPARLTQRLLRHLLPSAMLALMLAAIVIVMGLALAPFEPWLFAFRVGGLARSLDRRWLTFAAVLLAALGTASTASFATGALHDAPNVQDAVVYLFQARTLTLGRLWLPPPPGSSFFSQEFVLVFHGHWFGKYPLGWPALLSVGVVAHLPWLINPLLFGGSIFLLYLLGRHMYSSRVGLVASFLTLMSPLLLFLSSTYLAHTATIFLLLLAVYLIVRCSPPDLDETSTRRTFGRLFAAGAVLGLAFITRQLDTVAFVAPFSLLLLPRPRSLLPLGLGAAIPVLSSLLANRLITGGFFTNPYTLFYPFDRLGFGAQIGGPSRQEMGYSPGRALWNLAHNVQLMDIHAFGWPGYFALAFAVLPFLLGRATRWDRLLAASCVTVVAMYMLYFAAGDWYGFPRYYSAMMPALALLTARGFEALAAGPARVEGVALRGARTRVALTALLFAVLTSYAGFQYIPQRASDITRWNVHNRDAAEAVTAAHIRRAVVFQVQQGRSDWWPYGAVFLENNLPLGGGVVYARDEGCNDSKLLRFFTGRRGYRLNGVHLSGLRLPACHR